jgi:hypothetical protein
LNIVAPVSPLATFRPHSFLCPRADLLVALAWLAGSAGQAQTAHFALGATNVLEGPGAGSDSVVLAASPSIANWTATNNAPWLHVSVSNQSGAGSANVIFGYDANPGATRSGSLGIAGQTVTVVQAGLGYVAASSDTTIVSGLSGGLAVDGAGNVYMNNDAAIDVWSPASNAVTQLVSAGPLQTDGVAVDRTGNVYIANTFNNEIDKWTPTNNTLTTLVSNLNEPYGVAVDREGNVYIANTVGASILEWSPADSNVTYVVSGDSLGMNLLPFSVAVDAANNVYFGADYNGLVEEWMAGNSNVATLVTGLNRPQGVAVDGSGNVYTTTYGAFVRWSAASNNVTVLASSASTVAVDGAGNVYFGSSANNGIEELPHVFVNPNARSETPFAGTDALPAVLPATANLTGPFIPTSDQPWLTIGAITNGVVSYSFPFNNSSNRTAHITLFGQTIPVTQLGPVYSLGATNFLAGPSAGSNSVVLAVTPNFGIWTAVPNASWLHLGAAYQSGVGSTNVIFSYDANSGPTRSGTFTIAGQTLTVTQAGSMYVAAGALTSLVSSTLSNPMGVAVDSQGRVYIANTAGNTIEEWRPSNNAVTTLVTGLDGPSGVAVDGAGNVYFSDTGNNSIKEWPVSTGQVATLASGLNGPFGVAVDGAGNVYFADRNNQALKEWSPNGRVTTLAAGLDGLTGVAVDAAGNIYMANDVSNAVMEWSVADSNLTTLVSGLNGPLGVAVDGGGNVHIADSGDNTIQEWAAADGMVTPLVASGLADPSGVAVDGAGNVYIADSGHNAISELPYTFVGV